MKARPTTTASSITPRAGDESCASRASSTWRTLAGSAARSLHHHRCMAHRGGCVLRNASAHDLHDEERVALRAFVEQRSQRPVERPARHPIGQRQRGILAQWSQLDFGQLAGTSQLGAPRRRPPRERRASLALFAAQSRNHQQLHACARVGSCSQQVVQPVQRITVAPLEVIQEKQQGGVPGEPACLSASNSRNRCHCSVTSSGGGRPERSVPISGSGRQPRSQGSARGASGWPRSHVTTGAKARSPPAA